MQSPAPLLQFGRLALPMQEAAESQQFRSWILHQFHNIPVEKFRTTIGQYMYDMICSKTQHADKVSKISGMILAQYHGDIDLIDEYVHMMSDIGAFQLKCDEAIIMIFALKCAQSSSSGTSSDTASTMSNNKNLEAESAIWAGHHQPEMADALETLQTLPPTYDVDVLVRELEASKAELSKSRMVIGMLRSPGLPAVTVKPPVFDSHHDASADMRAALVATTSALNFMSQKTADEKNTIGDIMYRWESEFEAAGQGISVPVIVNEGMTAGYPLYTWAIDHRSRSMDSEGQVRINSQDPEDIMNWSAARFKHELHSSHFYVPRTSLPS